MQKYSDCNNFDSEPRGYSVSLPFSIFQYKCTFKIFNINWPFVQCTSQFALKEKILPLQLENAAFFVCLDTELGQRVFLPDIESRVPSS